MKGCRSNHEPGWSLSNSFASLESIHMLDQASQIKAHHLGWEVDQLCPRLAPIKVDTTWIIPLPMNQRGRGLDNALIEAAQIRISRSLPRFFPRLVRMPELPIVEQLNTVTIMRMRGLIRGAVQ
jgi:hypothetical protein